MARQRLDLTPEERERRSEICRKGNAERARRAAERRAARAEMMERRGRYFISLSCRGSYLNNGKHGRAAYRQYAWPKLFKTPEEAWAFAEACNPFKNSAAIPGRGRIVSFTVEFKLLPETAHG